MSWISYGQDGNQYGIYAQRLNVSGEKLGAEFQVNGYTKKQSAVAPRCYANQR